jgi:hypothetical protein
LHFAQQFGSWPWPWFVRYSVSVSSLYAQSISTCFVHKSITSYSSVS